MGLISAAYGTQEAVIGTEHSLSQQSGIGVYGLEINLSAMESGDTVILRLKTKTLAGGASGIAWEQSYSGVQTVIHPQSDVVMSDIDIIATLTQTAGTGRSYPWKLLRA